MQGTFSRDTGFNTLATAKEMVLMSCWCGSWKLRRSRDTKRSTMTSFFKNNNNNNCVLASGHFCIRARLWHDDFFSFLK